MIKLGDTVTETVFRKHSHFVTESIISHPFGITVDDTEYDCLPCNIHQISPTAFLKRKCEKP